MRVLTVASELPPVRSGVARSAGRIVDGLRDAGHTVDLRSYDDGRLLERDRLRLSSAALTLRMRDLRDYDVVHLHGPAPSLSDVLLLRLALSRRSPPLVYTHHFTVAADPGPLDPIYAAYDATARRLARVADAVVTTTRDYADRMVASGVRHVDVVPWGVDPVAGATPRPAERRPGEPLRVLVLGQLRRYKGHLIALDAARSCPDVRLTLAGAGPLEDEIVRAASPIANVDVVIGPSAAAVDALYRSNDLVVLPATNMSEAFGIVLLEGMARGCVPVASDLPGLAEVAGPSGRVVPPRDAPALRAVFAELAGDTRQLHRLSTESITRARELGWDRTLAAYADILQRVARGEHAS